MAQAPKDWTRWSPTRLRTEASDAETAGQVERAITLLEEAVRRSPEDAKSVRHLASLLTRAGRRPAATEHYRRLAEHYERDQLHAKAIAVWKIVLSGDPGFVGAHVKLGEIYAREGLRADARKHYVEALARYRASGRKAEAARIEARIDELNRQSDPGLRTNRHRVEPPPTAASGGGRPEPDGPDDSGRGRAASHGGEVDEADFVSERLNEGRLFRRYGLRDQAHVKLSELLARFPDHLEGRRELRDLLAEMGRHEEAAEHQRLLAAAESGARDPVGDLEGIEAAVADLPSQDPAPAGEESLEPLDLELLPPEGPAAEGGGPHLPIDLGEVPTPVPPPEAPDATPPEGGQGPEECRELRDLANGQVARDDYETRYDLGIAYREMGLLDEAIAEFQLASRHPRRLVEGTCLLADCFRDKGLPQLAVKWVRQALAAPSLDPQAAMHLRYELARALEACGDHAGAREIYLDLYGEDAGFRDVAKRV